MARNFVFQNATRSAITAVDTAVPAAPEGTQQGTQAQNQAAGVVDTAGCKTLIIDVATPAGATGTTTLAAFAWNQRLQAWVQDGATFTVSAVDSMSPARQFGRAKVLNWASDWAWVAVVTGAAGGLTGAGTTVSVTGVIEDK